MKFIILFFFIVSTSWRSYFLIEIDSAIKYAFLCGVIQKFFFLNFKGLMYVKTIDSYL